ncbi:MAG: sugar ABC transporter permease [Actinomycetia bacterium]|nr:sugar ABC transporter permease [Actinomycetes bacterium]
MISLFAIFLVLPLGIFLVFVLWPLLQAISYSFTNWSGFSAAMDVVWFDNYVRLAQDDIFLKAVGNNVKLAVLIPITILTLSLALAIMVTVGGASHGRTKGLAGAGFYRVVSFFPYTIPAVAAGLMFTLVMDPNNGLVNGALTRLGFQSFQHFPWLGDSRTAMPVMMSVMVWSLVGFYMVLFIAAIKGIPSEIFEAARIDGAGRLRTAVSITLPLIRENVQTAYIYLGIAAIDMYVYAQSMFPFGGPENTTLTMSQHLMSTALTKGQFGIACAMGVVMGVLTMGFAALVFLVNRLTGGKERVVL